MEKIRSKKVFPNTRSGLFSWAMYDWANSAFVTVIQTFVFAAYFTRQVAVDENIGSAQWGYTISAASLIVALGGPILGAVADQGGRRKPWLMFFTMGCILATSLLWFIRPSSDYVAPALLLVGLGTVCFEFANVFYNAMLPGLAPPHRLGRWSGWAWGLGYAGGLLCLVVALYAFIRAEGSWLNLDHQTAAHVRAVFLLVACWYFVFSLPILLFTPDTPGLRRSLADSIRPGLRQLGHTLKEVRRYTNIVRFLIARMFYIDGLATLFAFGGIYAAGTFEMSEQEVLVFGIGMNVTAGAGAAAFAWLDDSLGSKRTILLSLIGLLISGGIILLAESLTFFWIFGLLLGIFVGPIQASSRALMARLAPSNMRNEMFGLYALSGKATAFAGPFLVGWVTYLTSNQRLGMATILVFFLTGGLLLLFVSSPDMVGKD